MTGMDQTSVQRWYLENCQSSEQFRWGHCMYGENCRTHLKYSLLGTARQERIDVFEKIRQTNEMLRTIRPSAFSTDNLLAQSGRVLRQHIYESLLVLATAFSSIRRHKRFNNVWHDLKSMFQTTPRGLKLSKNAGKDPLIYYTHPGIFPDTFNCTGSVCSWKVSKPVSFGQSLKGLLAVSTPWGAIDGSPTLYLVLKFLANEKGRALMTAERLMMAFARQDRCCAQPYDVSRGLYGPYWDSFAT